MRSRATLHVSAFTLLLALWPAAIAAEPPAWDQAAATTLAREIVSELRAVVAASKDPLPQATVMQQRTRDAAAFQIRHLLTAAEELLKKLEEGWDRDVTQAYFRIVRDGAKQALVTYGDAQPARKPLAHWEAANRAIRRLGRYYDD